MEATLREVQDHLPEYIARAQADGEALTITDNGRPVARLVPLPKTPEELEREAIARLDALPWIRPGNGEKPSFEPLLRIEPGETTAAEMVGEMRG